jgi:threonine dehydratase
MIKLNEVKQARERIGGYVRRTPLLKVQAVKQAITEAELYLKLECMQVSGSFKARGAVNKLFSLSAEQVQRGIITASGGNHGLGVAYAGWLAKTPATIFLPENTPKIKAQKLESWGAKVIFKGAVWDEANYAALEMAEKANLTYFHPFADPMVIAGQGTVSLEILEDLADVDILLVAIGGGGLISGVSFVAKAINPNIKIIGIEPVGAPTLYESLKANKVIELAEITTAAGTLAPRQSAEINFNIIKHNVDAVVLISDEQMYTAARWLWFEHGIGAELSGAASIAALMNGKVKVFPGQKVCALVCGTGTDGMIADKG